MSNENFVEMLNKSDEDARVAKISRENVEAYILKRLNRQRSIGSAILDKKAGKRIYYVADAAEFIEKDLHWLAARNFKIEEIREHWVSFVALDAWGRAMGTFTVHTEDLNLSTWDYAKKVRGSIAKVKARKIAEAKRTQEQDLKKLRDQVKAAEKALAAAVKAAEDRGAVFAK